MLDTNTQWSEKKSDEEWLADLEREYNTGPPLHQSVNTMTDKQKKARVERILQKMSPHVSYR